MPCLKLSLSRSIAILTCTGLAVTVRADLVKLSPFLPPHVDEAAAPQSNSLQYMGWLDSADGKRFRVVDPTKKSGAFLKLGESDSKLDVALKQYGEERDTITVDHGGQTVTLSAHQSKVASGTPTMTTLPAMGMPAATPSPQLDAVAAEIAKRRALRDQASQASAMQPAAALPGAQPTR